LRIVPLLLQLRQFSYPSWKVIVSASRGHNYKSRAHARLFFELFQGPRQCFGAPGTAMRIGKHADQLKVAPSPRNGQRWSVDHGIVS
jgi:hypothetical protein